MQNYSYNLQNSVCVKISMAECTVPPESAELPRKPCAACFGKGITNVEFHLGWNQVLMGQQLQLPHPTSLHQLERDMLRVGAQSVG